MAAKRKSAAKAHLYGLQASLGLPQIAIEEEGEVDVCAGQTTSEVRAAARASAGLGSAMGVLFEDVGVGTSDMTNRLEGATVALGDLSVTTDANGNWSFGEIAAGTYTSEGLASGCEANSRTCTVPESAVIWCSFGLTKSSGSADPEPEIEPDPGTEDVEPSAPVAAAGALAGSACLAGTSAIIAPAYVTLNATGETVLYCGADWSFGELAAGTYAITVTAKGLKRSPMRAPASGRAR